MKFSDHIFYLFSLRRSVDELTTPPGGGGGGVGSKTSITVGQNLFFFENKVVIDFDFDNTMGLGYMASEQKV